jgi:CcmD family protein
MEILAIAFTCVWVSLALYVGWLGRQQRRLALQVEELRSRGLQPIAVGAKADRKSEKAAA